MRVVYVTASHTRLDEALNVVLPPASPQGDAASYLYQWCAVVLLSPTTT